MPRLPDHRSGPTVDPDAERQNALEIVSRTASVQGTRLGDIVDLCEDPADAYITWPNRLPLRDLARAYAEVWSRSEVVDEVHSELISRSRDERWPEQRAWFQSKRTAARKSALIEVEVSFWAMLGADFHATRVRDLLGRWENMSSYVNRSLEDIAVGNGAFHAGLRDACRELREVEGQLEVLMPDLGLTGAAQREWTERAESRDAMIAGIEEKLTNLGGGEAASNVVHLVRMTQSVD
jgi:hypothetical protein